MLTNNKKIIMHKALFHIKRSCIKVGRLLVVYLFDLILDHNNKLADKLLQQLKKL